jgi:hypothetical protein
VTIVRTQKGPAPGHVIAFFAQDQLILHRVLWACRKSRQGVGSVWVQGDAMPFSYAKIAVDDVVGTAVSLSKNPSMRDWWLRPPLSIAAVEIGFGLHVLVLGRARVRPRRRG